MTNYLSTKKEYLLNTILFKENKVTEDFLLDGGNAEIIENNEKDLNKLVHSLYELGYVLDKEVYDKIATSEVSIVGVNNKLVKLIGMVRGDITGEVFYPNFPTFVNKLTQEELDLFRNMHYVFRGVVLEGDYVWFVPSRVFEGQVYEDGKGRFSTNTNDSEQEVRNGKLMSYEIIDTILDSGYEDYLDYAGARTVIKFGTLEEAIDTVKGLIDSKVSLTEEMRESLEVVLELSEEDLEEVLPEVISRKDIMANIVALLVEKDNSIEPMKKYIKTSTDVLRVLDVMNGNDGSLTTFTYKKLDRNSRRVIMELLDTLNPYISSEDMFRNKRVWKGLVKVIHPFENRYSKYTNSVEAFYLLVNDDKSHTFSSRIEKEISELKAFGKVGTILEKFKTRPGEFARNLDLLLRETNNTVVLEEFQKVVGTVNTLILFQVKKHFTNYESPIRLVETTTGQFTRQATSGVSDFNRYIVLGLIEDELKRRMKGKEPLGKVYLDSKLKTIKMPLSLRTSSIKSSNFLTRGSRKPLGKEENVRLFTQWYNVEETRGVDIDLSILYFSEDLDVIGRIAYYNQRDPNFKSLAHSGDMTSARGEYGANEFIDFNKEELLQGNVRYVAMSTIIYSGAKTYKDLEVTAGWVEFDGQSAVLGNRRTRFNTKEIKNQFDIESKTKSLVPLVFDLKRGEVIWLDAYPSYLQPYSQVDTYDSFIKDSIVSANNDNSMSIYDLLDMHIKNRDGVEVFDKEDADVIYDLEDIKVSEILSEFI